MHLGHEVEHLHGLVIRLVELVLRCHDGADSLFQALVFRSLVGEPDRVEIMGRLQITYRAEGDVHNPVYIVVSLLHFTFQDTDNFEAEAVESDVLPERVAPGKQFFLGFRTDHCHAGALDLVFRVIEAALPNLEGAHINHVGIVAGDRKSENSGVILNANLLADLWRDVGDLGKVGGQRVYIFLGKADEHTRFLTTRLHRSAARNDDDELRAKIRKNVGARLAKTVAISKQHDHRGDAPSHAQHGQGCATAIVTHGSVGFPK